MIPNKYKLACKYRKELEQKMLRKCGSFSTLAQKLTETDYERIDGTDK